MNETAIRKIVAEAIKEHCAVEHQPLRLIPGATLALLSDKDFNSLWTEDGRLKPLSELAPHIAAMPGIQGVY